MDDNTMEIACKANPKLVQQDKEAVVPRKNNRFCQNNLRLSFKSRRMDDIMMSPCMMSPQSPLVRAMT
ncbi:1-aminocyclopropane-1-carboxylate synthase [Prunus yedoensis var. nudiflora]|uniref:1-aminocyclopropane-1-carboxylate synthase n=1 Tax=Prunus yedoensis var. nudiflora TaxID=2094558 RepID=A0A314UYB4_PRUYE|nr:1-aminocyclopropane-1-carboxylate synthase [Prunus yedoensis var. nudiflora]